MSKKTLPLGQKTITNILGVYYRAMEIVDFVYFVNFLESDDNAQVKMYRKEKGALTLVSDNYFASVGLLEDLEEDNSTWMSKRMQKNYELMKENEEV